MQIAIKPLLTESRHKLASISDTPQLEAEVLLAFILRKPRSFLYTRPEYLLSCEELFHFNDVLQRRCNKEPLAYITQKCEFWSLELTVNPATLIPRPETEQLVEEALKLFDRDSFIKVADLGTGSGAIALAIAHERPHWQVCATDICEQALTTAKENAQRLLMNNISFFQGDWFGAISNETFDLIVSNPPYIAETEWEIYADGLAHEPKNALVSGKMGLNAIQTISQTAKAYLKNGGYVLVEHGFLQGQAVHNLFAAHGYKGVRSVRDLANLERVTLGQKNS